MYYLGYVNFNMLNNKIHICILHFPPKLESLKQKAFQLRKRIEDEVLMKKIKSDLTQ